MATISRPRVYLDLNIGTEPVGRLTIELFVDKTPQTCENFRQLCTGEHDGLTYEKTPFHRVIDEFMIQGGDILNGDGTGVTSIYGAEFDDENLEWRDMDAAGLLCAANNGRDRNSSQFFITLEPCPHLNGRNTIFGRLVSGDAVLKRIASVAVDKSDRPVEPVLIARCGELEKRKKATARPQSPIAYSADSTKLTATDAASRGRRRRSDHDERSDEEMEDAHVVKSGAVETQQERRRRRQSDNIVDETIRGRARMRSGSRSRSTISSAIEESGDEEEQESARRKRREERRVEEDESDGRDRDTESDGRQDSSQKRKRGLSPDRRDRRDARHEDDHETRRRRRSLPNQYYDRYRPGSQRDERHRGQGEWKDRSDRYRPERDRSGRLNDGRLGNSGDDHGGHGEAAVKFKGRGVMKYRESDRAW